MAPGSGPATIGAINSFNGAVNLLADALTVTGTVQGFGGVTANARTGDLNAGGTASALDSLSGDVNASAALGSVYLTSTTAEDVYVTAAQVAHVGSATTQPYVPSDPIEVKGATAYLGVANSQDTISVVATNGSATAGDLTALGGVTVSATGGAASLHSATLGQNGTSYPGASSYPNTVAVTATGTGADVLIGDPVGTMATGFVTGATSITVQADRDVAVNVDQPIELTLVQAGRNVSLTAPQPHPGQPAGARSPATWPSTSPPTPSPTPTPSPWAEPPASPPQDP